MSDDEGHNSDLSDEERSNEEVSDEESEEEVSDIVSEEDEEDEEDEVVGRKRKAIKLRIPKAKMPPRKRVIVTPPPINTLNDLINFANNLDPCQYYNRINLDVLFKLVPHLMELDRMVAMERLKKDVLHMIMYYLQELDKGCNEDMLHMCIYGRPGSGKCLGIDTPVLMADGNVKMVQDIKKGEFLMGDDSTPRKVLSLARGQEQMYKIVPIKGESYIVNQSHILSLKYSSAPIVINYEKEKRYKVMWFDTQTYKRRTKSFGYSKKRTQEEASLLANQFLENLNKDRRIDIAVKDYIKLSHSVKIKLKGYRVGVDFPTQKVDFDPYLLGVWLGDGKSDWCNLYNVDEDVIEEVRKRLEQYDLSIFPKERVRWAIKNVEDSKNKHKRNGRCTNPFVEFLKTKNLLNNKHIPYEFKVNNSQVRREVLAGLLDTDGYYGGNCYEITQKREQLADDITYISRSLGLAAYKKVVRKSCVYKGQKREGTYYKVSISGAGLEELPLVMKHKQAHKRKQIKDVLVTGIKVEPLSVDNYYGFEIDGNRRFLLGDFTVTHNTTVGKILGKVFAQFGFLEEGKFRLVSRTDFIAKYLGQTAHRTKNLLEDCRGGVMFIDEAYSLASGTDHHDSYAKEALDTLNAYLTEHKKDFICIIAGYEDELNKTFFAVNKGLHRRFPWRFKIDDYKPEELRQIFLKIVWDNGWLFGEHIDVVCPVNFFEEHYKLFEHYGGDMEVLFAKVKISHTKRVFGHDIDLRKKVTRSDLEAGFSLFVEYKEQVKKDPHKRDPPPHMYT